MKTKHEMLTRMEAKIEADNEKFEVLWDTLISQMDAHQERMMVCLGKMEVQLWRQIQSS
jgi:FtsZ-binding cell division protein ZapB